MRSRLSHPGGLVSRSCPTYRQPSRRRDRSACDRCILPVLDHAGRALLIAGLGVYPNLGVIMLRVARRQAHFGEVPLPADPDTLILHHGSPRAMVQGSYWDTAG